MRNGSATTLEEREDRGNAVLSTEPLSDVLAIELPFGKQRRVAVAAIVNPRSTLAPMRVVAAHFDANGDRVASGGFYTMTESQARIDTFADSVVDFVREYGFDGIDIDYEYPTSNNQAGNPDDFHISDARRGQLFEGYVNLMRTLREKLDVAGAEDGEYYMLTTATPSSGSAS